MVNQLVMLFSLPLLATAVTYSMFWLPQIVRSAMRGRSAALTVEYLVGTTICRLMFAFCSYSGMIAPTWADKSFQITWVTARISWKSPLAVGVIFRCSGSLLTAFLFCSVGLDFRRVDSLSGPLCPAARSLRTRVLFARSGEYSAHLLLVCAFHVLIVGLSSRLLRRTTITLL